jgi:hypothetical protein
MGRAHRQDCLCYRFFAAAQSCGRFSCDAADRSHPGLRQPACGFGRGMARGKLLRECGLLQIGDLPDARPSRRTGRIGRGNALRRDAAGLRARVEVRRGAAVQPADAGGDYCAAIARGSAGGSDPGNATCVAGSLGHERIRSCLRLCAASLPSSSPLRLAVARPS